MTKRRRADQVKVKAERDEAQQTLGIVRRLSHASSPKHSLSVDASISTRAFGRFPSTAANRSRSLDPPFLENLWFPRLQILLFTLCTSMPILSLAGLHLLAALLS